MTQYDSKTVGRTNLGFATPQEYREVAEGLRRHQERLYKATDEAFQKIEAQRARAKQKEAANSTD